ncbi:MAG: hypothetical protein QW680_12890 [Pyrobaculum sp.]
MAKLESWLWVAPRRWITLVYTALYGPSFAVHAFANGVILTIITPLLVPLVYYATSV